MPSLQFRDRRGFTQLLVWQESAWEDGIVQRASTNTIHRVQEEFRRDRN